jgi:putative salt-induced outer membrane protein YdiY
MLAADKTDVVVLKNGDRLTCDIKGLSSGVLHVSLGYALGTISIDWMKVVRLESTHTFIFQTENGSTHRGTFETDRPNPAGPMTIKVIEGTNQTVVLEQARVIRIDPISEDFWKRFSGAVSSGLTYSKGNQATQYNFSSETEYLRERWLAQLYYNSNLTASSGDTTSTRNQLRLFGRRLMTRPQYFYGGVLSFLQSSEQGIRLQTTAGGGIGRYFKNTNRESISVIAGLGVQRTNYHEEFFSSPPQDVVSAMIGFEMRLFRFDRTNLNVVTDFYPALSDPGRIYISTNVSYFVKLFGKLSWNISFYGNADTRPPANFSGSDYGTVSGLSLTFGNR